MSVSNKKKVLTEKQLTFLDALLGEAKGNIRKAMSIAGYSATTSSTAVTIPLKEEIVDATLTFLSANAPKAAFGMVGVLDTPDALGARNSIAAAAQVLDRVGLGKKEKLEVSASEGGIVFLPPKSTDVDVEA